MPGLDITYHSVELGSIKLGTLIRPGIHGVADHALPRALHSSRRMHRKDPLGEKPVILRTGLALIDQEAHVRVFHGFIQVRVGKDNVRAFCHPTPR